MLEQVLDYIHNYFEKNVVKGTFTISSGVLDAPFLLDGQYFMVSGSVFNDGIHQYPASDLVDEVFEGEIRAMAVPPAVVALADEILVWTESNSNVIDSPFQSESFGGYSYTKKSGSDSGTPGSTPAWASVFGSRLNKWRKIS